MGLSVISSRCHISIEKDPLKCRQEEKKKSTSTMSSTSQKHRNFVAEPMGDKDVTDLAGIGEVLGQRLTKKGFDKASVVLGQFLVLKKNKELFVDWLKDTAQANSKQAADCHQCLSDWRDEFLGTPQCPLPPSTSVFE